MNHNNPNLNQNKPNQTGTNSYVRYMGLAGQMIAIILVGFGIGTLVEKKIPSPKHLIVAFTTLGFVCIAMYVVIKDIISSEH